MATSHLGAVRMANLGVSIVAITAAVISFTHVRTVAVRSGESDLTSWLLPASIDGAVVAAVSVLLADSRAGRRPAALTWLLLGLGLSASLAANIASAEPTAMARAVAAWPPIALALGIEVLAGLVRRGDAASACREAGQHASHAAPASVVSTGSINGSARIGGSADGMSGMVPIVPTSNRVGADRQPAFDDSSAVSRIRQLDQASPRGQASRLEIQKALGCGGSRAARLADLARRSDADAVR